MHLQRNKSRAFTLFELLVVIAIIGILASFVAGSGTRQSHRQAISLREQPAANQSGGADGRP